MQFANKITKMINGQGAQRNLIQGMIIWDWMLASLYKTWNYHFMAWEHPVRCLEWMCPTQQFNVDCIKFWLKGCQTTKKPLAPNHRESNLHLQRLAMSWLVNIFISCWKQIHSAFLIVGPLFVCRRHCEAVLDKWVQPTVKSRGTMVISVIIVTAWLFVIRTTILALGPPTR